MSEQTGATGSLSFEEQARKNVEQMEEDGGANLGPQEQSSQESQGTEQTNSLGKVSNREHEKWEEERKEVEKKYGWQNLQLESFPTGGYFYPSGTNIQIRAANTEEIRHFSSIDENDPYSITNHLNDIAKSCSRVVFPDGVGSYRDIKEEDRIFVILAIRALTFERGENRLSFTQECHNCHKSVEFEVDNDTLIYEKPDPQLDKYYSEEESCYIVKTKNLGEIRIEPPAIGIMQVITQYIQELQKEGKTPDQTFIKILPYMINDWRGFNKDQIKNYHLDYMSWGPKKLSLMLKLTEWIAMGAKDQMKNECENCGAEVTADVKFPGGIKNLFVISDFSDELL